MSSVKTLRKELLKKIKSNTQLGRLEKQVVTSQMPKLIMLNKIFDKYIKSGNKKQLTIKKADELKNDIIKFEKERKEIIRKYKENKIKSSIINETKITIKEEDLRKYQFWTHFYQLTKMKKQYPNALYQQLVRFYDWKNDLKETLEINTLNPYERSFKGYLQVKLMASSSSWWVPTFIHNNKFSHVDIITRAYTIAKDINKQIATIQEYKDNDSGACVYDGCVSFFKNKPKDQYAKAILNKLIKNEDIYKKAYKENELIEIAKVCKASIKIVDLIHGNDRIINEAPLNRYSIYFINSKYNHLDILAHNYNEINEVSKEEYNELKTNSIFYIEKYNCLYCIFDKNASLKLYKIKDSEYKIINDKWKKDNKLELLYINTDDDVMQLLKNYDFSMHRFLNNNMPINNDLYKELDLKKAYYNYSNIDINKYYKGVPSGSFVSFKCNNDFTIEDFNKNINNNLIGFYEVKILTSSYALDILGFKVDSVHVLFSSMIELLKQYIQFEFINISYCPSVHIPFSKELLDKFTLDGKKADMNTKEETLKGFCKTFGCMMIVPDVANITVKPLNDDVKYYSILENENTTIYKGNGLIKISKNNENFKTHIHISYAIHSYCKTLILEQLLTMNINNIFGVKLDSIVYKNCEKPTFDENVFSHKDCNIENMMLQKINHDVSDLDYGINELIESPKETNTSEYYNYFFISSFYDVNLKNNFILTGEYINNRVVMIGGQGGAGKTYSLLEYLRLLNTVYSTNGWNLIEGQQKKRDKKFIGLSIPKLTGTCNGKKCEQTANKNIKIIILDEATLNNKQAVDYIIKKYYWCFIFLLGDIDKDGFYYQCSIDKNIYTDFSKCQYIKYTKTFRFDEQLNNKLQELRAKMREYDGDINLLYNYVKMEYKNHFINKEDLNFLDTDVGISSCNDLGEHTSNLSEYYINKGAKPQYYIKTTDMYKGLLRGAIIDEKPTHKNYECKLFKTIHSYQGLDINHDQRIIIAFDKVFDYNLFYTAFSRARRTDQIIILNL